MRRCSRAGATSRRGTTSTARGGSGGGGPNSQGWRGFGQAYTASIPRNWADLPYEDTIRAAEWLRAQPWIDPERMVAGGGSYGGYLPTLPLCPPHPFRTLIPPA